MQVVGAQWLMLTLTHSTTFVALIQTASALPVMLFSVSAGVISDLIDRRRFLLVAQTHADCSGDAWHTCAGRGGDAVGAAYPGLRRRCRSRVCVTDVADTPARTCRRPGTPAGHFPGRGQYESHPRFWPRSGVRVL